MAINIHISKPDLNNIYFYIIIYEKLFNIRNKKKLIKILNL